MIHNLPPNVTYTADMGAMVAIIGTWAGFLPAIAAFLAAVWYLLQIYDWFTKK